MLDLHAHLGSFPLPGVTGRADDLLRLMDRLDTETTCASSAEAIFYDMHAGNAALARDLRRHHRLRGYVFGNPNHVPASVEEITRWLQEPGFVGVKLYSGGYVGKPLDCEEHQRILSAVAGRFPWALVLFHCGENDPRNFPGLVRLASEFPELTFLAGHMGSKLWRDALPVLSQAPNIVAEISAPVPARCRIEDAVRWMGAERVVFGSDFPLIHPAYMLGCVRDADVSEEAKRLILEGNARRLLGRAQG